MDEQFTQQVQLVGIVAREAVDDPGAVAHHPEIIDALEGLSENGGLNAYFGGNGHDPNGYVSALASALEPYREQPLDDPQLVGGMMFLAWALAEKRSPTDLADMQVLA